MKRTVKTEKVPIKLWLDPVEPDTMRQARNLANLPFVVGHVALMPDAHPGYGMPIGGVLATEGVVIPNAVGVDIGCGMCAVKTSLVDVSTENLKRILGEVRRTVPLGFKHHRQAQALELMPEMDKEQFASFKIVSREYKSALAQIGTLGGGNHFIEIQSGDDNHIWLMIHSGSRNLGYKVANYYHRLATEMNLKWGAKVPAEWQLAYLPIEEKVGQLYLREMQYCVDFAFANRLLMVERVKDAFRLVATSVSFEPVINIAHNYAARERHFDKDVLVHRKGATRARAGEIGIIPGSQGSASYLVRGKGNAESLASCSHGAGRKMGRKQAQRLLDLATEKRRLDDQGIIHSMRHPADLDEAVGAYKDIDEVISSQLDLVDVLVKLRPLAVLKG